MHTTIDLNNMRSNLLWLELLCPTDTMHAATIPKDKTELAKTRHQSIFIPGDQLIYGLDSSQLSIHKL